MAAARCNSVFHSANSAVWRRRTDVFSLRPRCPLDAQSPHRRRTIAFLLEGVFSLPVARRGPPNSRMYSASSLAASKIAIQLVTEGQLQAWDKRWQHRSLVHLDRVIVDDAQRCSCRAPHWLLRHADHCSRRAAARSSERSSYPAVGAAIIPTAQHLGQLAPTCRGAVGAGRGGRDFGRSDEGGAPKRPPSGAARGCGSVR